MAADANAQDSATSVFYFISVMLRWAFCSTALERTEPLVDLRILEDVFLFHVPSVFFPSFSLLNVCIRSSRQLCWDGSSIKYMNCTQCCFNKRISGASVPPSILTSVVGPSIESEAVFDFPSPVNHLLSKLAKVLQRCLTSQYVQSLFIGYFSVNSHRYVFLCSVFVRYSYSMLFASLWRKRPHFIVLM